MSIRMRASRVTYRRIVVEPTVPGEGDEAVDVEEPATRSRGCRAALEREARERDAPTFARRADAIRVGNDHVVEEHLREVRVAVHLAERAHVDSRGAEIESERGDAPVLRDVRVVPGEQQPVARVRAAARPYLLAADPPRVTGRVCTRREAREIGAGARFGEQLAPDLGAVRDHGEPAGALLGCPVREEGRPDELEADEVGVEVGHGEGSELVAHCRELRPGSRRGRRTRGASSARRGRCLRARRDNGDRLRGRRCRRRAPRPAPDPAGGARAGPRARRAPRRGSRRRCSRAVDRRSELVASGVFCAFPLAVRGRSRAFRSARQFEARQTRGRGDAHGARRAGASRPSAAITNAQALPRPSPRRVRRRMPLRRRSDG